MHSYTLYTLEITMVVQMANGNRKGEMANGMYDVTASGSMRILY